SGNLNFNGRGFTKENINTEISGTISSFGFEGYNYQRIKVAGKLKNPIFNGELSVYDPNLQMEFKGMIDATSKNNKLDFEVDVDFADLNKLNLVTRDSIAVFTGNVVVEM